MIILSGFALDNIVHSSIAGTEFIDAELCTDCVYVCSLALTVFMYAVVPHYPWFCFLLSVVSAQLWSKNISWKVPEIVC